MGAKLSRLSHCHSCVQQRAGADSAQRPPAQRGGRARAFPAWRSSRASRRGSPLSRLRVVASNPGGSVLPLARPAARLTPRATRLPSRAPPPIARPGPALRSGPPRVCRGGGWRRVRVRGGGHTARVAQVCQRRSPGASRTRCHRPRRPPAPEPPPPRPPPPPPPRWCSRCAAAARPHPPPPARSPLRSTPPRRCPSRRRRPRGPRSLIHPRAPPCPADAPSGLR